MTTDTDTPWYVDALCAQTDPELFFPVKGDNGATAKWICRRCDVRAECLADAMATGQSDGVHGGATRGERRRM